jgi:hypothetical protein
MANHFFLTRLLMVTLSLVVFSANADDWSYQFEPYVIGLNIEGNAGIGRVTGRDVNLDFGDVLDTLDMTFMGRFEAHHSNGWGVALDYAYVDLGDDLKSPRGGVLDAQVKQGIFEALLVRRTQSGDQHIDYFAGLRWWDNEVNVMFDPVILPGTLSAGINEDWIDPVIGVRWTNPLNEKWSFLLHGDVGGAGVGSDFTASAMAGFRYKIKEWMELDLQYKALWVDYETGTAGQPGFFKYDTTTHGPIIGLIFKF